MPTYKLEPIEGTERHPFWRASIVPPTPVWLQAQNPDLARQRMQLAAKEATRDVKRDELRTPWADTALVRCTEDGSCDAPLDRAIFANGKITLKLS
jgi:hypothetical protein